MHLLLVTIHAFHSPQAVPLAAACLKAALDSRHKETLPLLVFLADYFCGDSLESIHNSILGVKPDIVSFPLYVWNRTECCSLARRLRRENPSLTILAGGPEATADPAGVLAEAPFDFLVVGEGEVTLSEAVERLAGGASLDGLAGIARRRGDGVDLVRRPPLADPGSLPSPYLSGVLDSYIPNGVLWQLSRGCTFGCEFCFDGMGDRTVRRYPLERLEAELDYFVRRGANQVIALDSTFNLDGKRAKAVLRLIRKKAPRVHFHFEVRCELLDAEQARLFRDIACSLQIGLQTADAAVARAVGRSLDRRAFAEKIGLLNREGIAFGFDLIYGLPGDNLARFKESLDFALHLYPNGLDIFPLALLPGTVLSARAGEVGLRHLPTPPYTLVESPTFSSDDLIAARRLAAACDLFYSRGKAVAWFNGIVAALRVPPSVFLEKFGGWLIEKAGRELSEADFRDEEIWELQREFLSIMFVKRKVKRLLAAALDFVDYHFFYGCAVMAVPPRRLSRRDLARADILRRPLSVAGSTRLARFSYEILDLLESGEPDLPYIHASLRPVGSFAAIYPREGEVATESLAEPYYRLLQGLDGANSAGAVAARLGIPIQEAREFLTFAAVEGIIVFR
jgi:radical SAM superfamily enzyme YgiQ (UPF0313 family)